MSLSVSLSTQITQEPQDRISTDSYFCLCSNDRLFEYTGIHVQSSGMPSLETKLVILNIIVSFCIGF